MCCGATCRQKIDVNHEERALAEVLCALHSLLTASGEDTWCERSSHSQLRGDIEDDFSCSYKSIAGLQWGKRTRHDFVLKGRIRKQVVPEGLVIFTWPGAASA